MASAPFYQWLIKITKDISWSQNIILLTWQKLAPVYLLIFQNSYLYVMAIPLSAILGTILIINKTHVKEIFGLSSLFNLRWMLTSIILRIKAYLTFFLMYSTVTVTALFIFWKRNQESLSEKNLNTTEKEGILVAIIRLAGIPPLLGFIIKWIVLEKIAQNITKILPVILLTRRAISLYIYLRIINPNLITNYQNLQKKGKKKEHISKNKNPHHKHNPTWNTLPLSFLPHYSSIFLYTIGAAWTKRITLIE